ncbi:hypothetical protein [Serratia quinivorans]|uniref:hypothetical protein n=1 Tax=Serratia quinivorans TaxID=137545 RepID=UPI003981BF4C
MTQTLTTELLSVVRAMRDYIDALPSDVVASLPTMPGFDRDWADEVIEAANREAQPVRYQYREIGEGGWRDCDKAQYDYCQRSPELDARIAPAEPETAFPAARDKSQGWKIDPEYLQSIVDAVGCSDDEGTPSMEMVEAVLLAAAPPAPAVTDEKAITPFFDTLALDTAKMVMCDVNRRSDFLGGDTQLLSRIQCRIDNACRAAMLAQPVSQGKLPEGFKLMPIEITDEIAEAIAMEARCCGGIALCIYEAALAAAPEGGNG